MYSLTCEQSCNKIRQGWNANKCAKEEMREGDEGEKEKKKGKAGKRKREREGQRE